MPKLKNRLPKNCRDRNQAFSKHNGKRYYHGVWGTPEAEKSYKRFIAALLECPNLPLQDGKIGEVLVSELATAYLDTIEKSRMHPSHISHFKQTIGFLVEIYGETAANEFSPKKLKVVRAQMVRNGKLCRKVINDYVCRIVRIFAWGVEEELAKTDTKALREVKPLQEGETGTFDHPERQEVPDWVIEATLPFLPPVVSAMVQVQRLTGMRPSEVLGMRVGDIDQSRDNGLWYYSPKHKTEQHIGEKPMPLGKPEQRLIAPYLIGKKPESAVFSPRTAMKERAQEARSNRKSKLTPSQRERDAKRALSRASKVGEFYDRNSYRKAVLYAIQKGNRHGIKIPHWTPYPLRKNFS